MDQRPPGAAAEPHPESGERPAGAGTRSGASWTCLPAQPPQDHPLEPLWARGYLPAPRRPRPNCPSGSCPCQAPTATPAATANCRPSPFQVLTPNRPSQTPLPAASPFLPEPTATPGPGPGSAFLAFPPGQRLSHTCQVPGEQLGAGGRGRELEPGLGAEGWHIGQGPGRSRRRGRGLSQHGMGLWPGSEQGGHRGLWAGLGPVLWGSASCSPDRQPWPGLAMIRRAPCPPPCQASLWGPPPFHSPQWAPAWVPAVRGRPGPLL